MNIEAYNLDSLRKLIRSLQDENRRLKEQLEKANIAYAPQNIFEEKTETIEEYDPDQGERILYQYITEDMVNKYFAMFWGRTDVYAKRGAKGGYFPQCNNRWNNRICPKQCGEKINCEACEHTEWTKLEPKKIMEHLLGYREDGADVLGVYPLFPDGMCRFIVFDFDNHEKGAEKTDFANVDDEWHEEVDALRLICERNGITPLVERSRSGRGAHVWIFFKKPIPASLARNFGFLLLDKGSSSINLKSFHYYDRMYPSQDVASSIGNLIALPLQGRALKNGNSAFVDKNWNAYPDQWDILLNHTKKFSSEDIEKYIAKWQMELAKETGKLIPSVGQNRPKPWKKKDHFVKSDVIGKMHIVLADGIYVDTLNLMPRLQNQIRSMAAFDNPVFYKNKRLGYSNYYNFSAVYMGKDAEGYICIPRGLYDKLIVSCKEASIEYEIIDHREKGRPIRVSFNGDLKTQQDLAAQRLLAFDHGVLSAATAFGKTVVCSYLIAERKVNTLILLHSKDLLEQWVEELNRFLTVDEELPFYKTKSGREKRRDSLIGILHGSKNTLTGIIDVAMAGSVYSKGRFNDLLNSYGMVLMDECHHCGSNTSVKVMKKVNARYVYGVSATPKRGDDLEKIIYMLLGPVRHSYTAKERAAEQGIGHYVYPRLDTLMLAAPVSFSGRLEQYIGRLNRDYEGKEEVIVYDYVDSHIRVFDNMYAKRLRTYKRTGFQLMTNGSVSKQTVNAIYDSENYMDVFERDVIEAEKGIVVSSPELTQDKVERFIYLVKLRQEAGVEVTVITVEPQNKVYGSSEFAQKMIQEMQENGIYVMVKDEVAEHFAVIDEELVWHGGMNLLGREDAWDNLMRIKSFQVATELLEIALGKEEFSETT